MVRKINQIRLLDDELSRQLSFAKRRNGLIKKALELYMVCDVDVVFIAFSPSGRLSYFYGDKRVEDVVSRFLALPEKTQRFHIPDLELQLLVDILGKLKDQTLEHIQRDSTILAIQRELAQVKEEIQCLSFETRRYEPLQEAIMTIEEANVAEETLEEVLVNVQERKKELAAENQDHEDASQSYDPEIHEGCSYSLAKQKEQTAENQGHEDEHQPFDSKIHNEDHSYILAKQKELTAKNQDHKYAFQSSNSEEHNKDASQPSDSKIGAENPLPKPFEEVQQVEPQHQPNEDFNMNYQYPTLEGIDDMLFGRNSSSEDIPLEATALQPQHAGLQFSSLVTATNIAETLSPIRPHEQSAGSSSEQRQLNFLPEDVFQTYLNWNLLHQTSEHNDQSTYESGIGFNFPISNLIFPNVQLPSSPESLQVPHYQRQFPMQAPSYYQQQMPIGSNSNISLLGNPQWSNLSNLQPHETPFRPNFPNFQNSVSGLDNMCSESESSTSFSRPPNLRMDQQSMGLRNNMGPNLSMNLHGPFLDYYQQAQLQAQGSTSSAQKRKLPWDDDIALRSLSSYQNGNSTYFSDTVPPEPSLLSYQNGNTAYPNYTIPPEPSFPSHQNGHTAYPNNTIPPETSYQNGYTAYPNNTIPPEPSLSSYQFGHPAYPNNSIPSEPSLSTNYQNGNTTYNNTFPTDPRLSSYQTGNTAYPINSMLPSSRYSTNAVYDAEYQAVGLPVDPHFRILQNMIFPENDNGYRQQE